MPICATKFINSITYLNFDGCHNNPPQVAQNPNPHQDFQGSTPLWAMNLGRLSHEQGQPPPYNGDRSFYNLNEGGSPDRVLPILVRRVARNVEQGRTNFNQAMEIHANSGVNTVRLCHLNDEQELTRTHTDAQQIELNACQSEVRDLRQNQVALRRRVWETEQQLAESRAKSSTNQNNTPRE